MNIFCFSFLFFFKQNQVHIDLTPPVPGSVYDGREEGPTDVVFSSESATVSSQWEGFTDPESGITEYKVSVFRRKRMRYI